MATARQLIRCIAGFVLCGVVCGAAQAGSCGREAYFSPADVNNQAPLKKPASDFAELRRQADSGDAVAQRSLAVAYETGYLVSQCPEKALYWYRKAGKSGDRLAQVWIDHHAQLESMRLGPECLGTSCRGTQGEAFRSLALVADPSNHFFAPVTINGVTVRGIINTGATAVSMSSQTAKQMGISYQDGKQVTIQTANGSKSGNIVTVSSVAVGNITLRDVTVSVSDADMPVLIGMSFLRRVNVDIRGSSMTLTMR